MKNKKALSAIISTVLLIALTLVLIALVFKSVIPFVKNNLNNSGNCYKVLNKVSLNNDWTCYNSSSKEMQFSIDLKDTDLEGVLISVDFDKYSDTFTIKNKPSEITNVSYLGFTSGNVSLPSKEGAKTYVLRGVDVKPQDIQIATIFNGKTCAVSDSIKTIYTCS